MIRIWDDDGSANGTDEKHDEGKMGGKVIRCVTQLPL